MTRDACVTGMLPVAVLAVAMMVVPAAAQPKGKVCKESCDAVIAACEQTTQSQGFGTVVGKRCKKSVLKRCKQDGAEVCQDFCGDGAVSGTEECDGTALGDATCAGLGFTSGTLACGADCRFDTAGCESCGNEMLDAGEDCDGSALGDATCASLGFASGTLGCRAGCGFDTSRCESCGNGIVDAGEACDPEVPAGVTCDSLGFDAGTVACTACAVDSSGCGSVTTIAFDRVDLGGAGAGWLGMDGNPFLIDEGAMAELAGAGDDAFDGGWKIHVNGTPFTPGDGPESATLFSSARRFDLTSSTQTLSGLEVTGTFTVFQSSPTLRILVSLENPTASAIMVNFGVDGDFGSDEATTIETSASGDATVDTADRWFITSDGPLADDPVNTSVLYGPGSPLASTTFESVTDGSEILEVTFAVTVPAGQTRYLAFFAQMSGTADSARARVTVFDTNAGVEAAGLLEGLSEAQRGMILNWDLD